MPIHQASDKQASCAIQLRFSFEPIPPPPVAQVDLPAALFVRHRRARRYILRLTPDGRPRVTIPRGGSKREAAEFLGRHGAWIARQRLRQVEHREQARRAWTTGDRIWLRGVPTLIRVMVAGGRQRVALGAELLDVGPGSTPRDAVERHLRAVASLELPGRLRGLADEHGLPVSRVVVRDQRSQWGSCSPGGAISLNWRLVQMPESVRDYILIHELMHLREANHSRRFWRLVNRACPWHLEARRWLRRHGHDLHQPVAGRSAADAGAPPLKGVEQQ